MGSKILGPALATALANLQKQHPDSGFSISFQRLLNEYIHVASPFQERKTFASRSESDQNQNTGAQRRIEPSASISVYDCFSSLLAVVHRANVGACQSRRRDGGGQDVQEAGGLLSGIHLSKCQKRKSSAAESNQSDVMVVWNAVKC